MNTFISNKMHFAIIGTGKISSHIPYLFENVLRSFINNSFSNQSLIVESDLTLEKDIKENFCFLDKSTDYQSLDLSRIKVVFLAVPDSQILETYKNLKKDLPLTTAFYHLSGALYFPDIIGIHPLMTFSKSDQMIPYDRVPMFTDNEKFYANHSKLNMNLKYISPALKIKYHAMAVMLGNFSQYYLQIVKENFPEQLSFQDYKMLTEFSVKNIFNDDSKKMLTGPLVRGDLQTIQKHKDELRKESSKILDIYLQMEELFHQELNVL